MKARLTALAEALGNQFWLWPAVLVAVGLLLGEMVVWLEQAGIGSGDATLASWLYRGGEAGARALLSAVASSTIGVAGTTFSITVAALSLASGQMGPRLLRNFVRDRGNQIVLGIFLGTFTYCLAVLRTVRSVAESKFVPHLGVSGALLLALLCVGTLIWFVHHVATSINVETVIEAVSRDLESGIVRLTDEEPSQAVSIEPRTNGTELRLDAGGYVHTLDTGGLADWASQAGVTLRLSAKPGDFVPAGCPVGTVTPSHAGAAEAVSHAIAFGGRRIAAQDLEFSVRQLVEVAVRALSPGINDPFTATAVLDRLGEALCRLSGRYLPNGVIRREDQTVLTCTVTTYAGLCDAMFHMIRQNAATTPSVLIRVLDTLNRVASVEADLERRGELRRHADLVLAVARTNVTDPAGAADLKTRYEAFAGATAC